MEVVKKIAKYLQKQGATMISSSSHSWYFEYRKNKIRVSDHSPLANFSYNLSIMVTDENYFVVILERTIKIFPSLKKLYEFIKNYLFITKSLSFKEEQADMDLTKNYVQISDVAIDNNLYAAIPERQRKKIKEHVQRVNAAKKDLENLMKIYKEQYAKHLS